MVIYLFFFFARSSISPFRQYVYDNGSALVFRPNARNTVCSGAAKPKSGFSQCRTRIVSDFRGKFQTLSAPRVTFLNATNFARKNVYHSIAVLIIIIGSSQSKLVHARFVFNVAKVLKVVMGKTE